MTAAEEATNYHSLFITQARQGGDCPSFSEECHTAANRPIVPIQLSAGEFLEAISAGIRPRQCWSWLSEIMPWSSARPLNGATGKYEHDQLAAILKPAFKPLGSNGRPITFDIAVTPFPTAR